MKQILIFFSSVLLSIEVSATCTPPDNFRTIVVSNNSATLIWEGSPSEYAIIVKFDQIKPDANENGLSVKGHSVEYKNLTSGTKYYAFIRAICTEEQSSWSDGITFETTTIATNGDISDANYTLPPSLQIGIGLGPNFSSQNSEYYISPLNNTLQKNYLTDVSLVGSIVVSYTPRFSYVKTKQVLNTTTKKLETEIISNSEFKAPGWLSILSSFNLGQFNTSIGFNTKLSGGIGLGVNIQNVMQIGMFCDFTRVRVLRNNYADSLNRQLLVNNIPVTALDVSDNRFFKDSTQPSFSIKFIYILSRRKNDIETGLGHEPGFKQP